MDELIQKRQRIIGLERRLRAEKKERDELVDQMIAEGHGLRAISQAAGISRALIYKRHREAKS